MNWSSSNPGSKASATGGGSVAICRMKLFSVLSVIVARQLYTTTSEALGGGCRPINWWSNPKLRYPTSTPTGDMDVSGGWKRKPMRMRTSKCTSLVTWKLPPASLPGTDVVGRNWPIATSSTAVLGTITDGGTPVTAWINPTTGGGSGSGGKPGGATT